VEKPYGYLTVAMNFKDIDEEEFNDWYDTEHMVERIHTPGFMNARRWLGAYDPRISVSNYDLESFDVLKTPAYQAIVGVNLSPWSRRIVRKATRICRFLSEQAIPGRLEGALEAEGMLLFAATVAPELEAEFEAWYAEEHLPRMAKVPGVLRARRFRVRESEQPHKFFSIYDLKEPEVEKSQDWADAANTPWTAKLKPQMQNVIRLVLRRYHKKGE
jgi:heme-degrading monooxygenase HmoA